MGYAGGDEEVHLRVLKVKIDKSNNFYLLLLWCILKFKCSEVSGHEIR
jgi:hypothetical protein